MILEKITDKQKKEKITIKRTKKLKKGEERILIASADVTKIIIIAATASELAEIEINCNVLILLELIFERLRINAKRNGTTRIFIDEIKMFVVLKIKFESLMCTFLEKVIKNIIPLLKVEIATTVQIAKKYQFKVLR